MQYTEIKQLYIIHHTTGFGEQGGEPIKILEIVGSADSYNEALELGRKLYPKDPSGWTYNNFEIVLNDSHLESIIIRTKQQEKYEKIKARLDTDPNTIHIQLSNGIKLAMEYNPLFDTPSN